MAKVLQSRKGSPTMEYIVVIACGVALALLLNQVVASAEVQGSLKDKIMQVLTGQNMAVSLDEDKPKEQSIEERKDDLFGRPDWIKDLTSGYQSLKNKFKKGLSEAWENVKNKDLGEVTQSLWNNTTNALDSAWQWAKENKEVVASAGVIIAGVGLLLIPGMEPLGLMLLANWGLSLGFGALLNGGKVDKTVLLGAAIGGAAGAIGGGAASAFFSGLTKLAPGLGTAITGSRFLGPIISGGKQILGKAPAFVQRMAGELFSKMGAMTATEGAITSGVDDWLRGKELNWKRAVLSGLAGATLVGFASGAYPLVQPLLNKATTAIEKHTGPISAKIKPAVQNVGKCLGYQQTPRYFALIKFGDGNFIECLYAQAYRGGGGGTNGNTNTNPNIDETLPRGAGTKPVSPNDKLTEPLPLIQFKANPNLTPQAGSRATAINRAWRLEKELVQQTGRGTYPWTESEINELLRTGKVRGYTGHHIINAENGELGAAWQGDPRNIRFLYNRGKGNEHVAGLKGHRGKFTNPTNGRLIDRQAMIEYYRKHPLEKE
ncbi:hypothetical protein [Laceyella sediminis]|uniref:hypothetical protein n=1 Tax=Laceyella sediminis TaxID=573074 RepID=UPI0024820D36|nr:hypothetical protein [Laceyella sediminis]